MDFTVSEMTLNDINSISQKLFEDFDDFWSFKTLRDDITSSLSKYFVAKKADEIIRFRWNKNDFRYI